MSELQRIMYIEDDPDIQAVAEMALEMVGGFTVKICSSGEEALREVADFHPDLILLDVMMPHMDGPETLERLREKEELADVPVVFLSAKVQPTEVAHYTSLGARDVIAKPFDPMALSDQVRAIWDA
jgi:CheY-like chemotaxis protein